MCVCVVWHCVDRAIITARSRAVQAIALLPTFMRTAASEAALGAVVERVVQSRLPARSREYDVTSAQHAAYVACLDALLAAMVASASTRLFQVFAYDVTMSISIWK